MKFSTTNSSNLINLKWIAYKSDIKYHAVINALFIIYNNVIKLSIKKENLTYKLCTAQGYE